MARPSPTPFETDMAMHGLQAGRHPIPASVTSRPEPGEYGGMYDKKAASPKVEEKVSKPEPDAKKGEYKVRDVKPSA